MLKVIAASMVLVVVIGSGAFATESVLGQIQNQASQIGLTNNIDLLHGSQQASSLQNLVVNNTQNATGMCAADACQSIFGSIGQSANASGNCALVGVAQTLGLAGTQAQQVGQGVGAKAELQGLALTAQQTVCRADGEGSGSALHTIVANADQKAQNPAGVLEETATIMGMQTSSTTGAPGATSLVDAKMTVTTTQTQGSL
jgi:hypothetical protein